ncbi:MAG: PEP-CTERM sorting domain-containing protein [Phycisphaerae bacterium]|nr:PEP-CTERM sorting domain-containing protein [Phycisphaerae bacterium]
MRSVTSWGVYKDQNGNQTLDSADSVLGCITNMLQYMCAQQSYQYRQFGYPAGADLSGSPSSTDGGWPDLGTLGQYNQTWLKPEKDTLQFWLGWSEYDHRTDLANSGFVTSPKGYNFGLIMNAEPPATWDNALGKMVHHVTNGVVRNNVQLGISVKGSSLTPMAGESTDPVTLSPRVVISDDFTSDPSKYYSSYSTKELPTPPVPTTANPYPSFVGQELTPNGAVPPGWQSHFNGNWTYNEDTTDGGVLGNLRPTGSDPAGTFQIRITLDQLGIGDPTAPGYTGIKKLVFYSFNPPANYTSDQMLHDPSIYLSAWTRVELDLTQIQQGDTIFIAGGNFAPAAPGNENLFGTDCCNLTPEPFTIVLMGIGGLGAAGAAWRRRRQKAA